MLVVRAVWMVVVAKLALMAIIRLLDFVQEAVLVGVLSVRMEIVAWSVLLGCSAIRRVLLFLSVVVIVL